MQAVSVDAHFARFGGKSYAINKINSVEVRSHKPHGEISAYLLGIMAFMFALSFLGSVSDPFGPSYMSLGVAIACGFFAYSAWQRSKIVEYQLFLMTSSSEAQAFVTRDQDEVFQLRDRIEDAMASA